jgi:O-acetyl-ADP-ribose deacetylase (regulator of RNase III)
MGPAITITVGDVLSLTGDVLISTANPWLNMSGGVNAAIGERGGGEIQAELHAYLKSQGKAAVPAGTVVRTSAGSLPFCHILHAVAIDPFYDSSSELVTQTMTTAFHRALELAATTIVTPTLGTGYGRLPMESFAKGLLPLIRNPEFEKLRIQLVVRKPPHADVINAILSSMPGEFGV